MASINLEPAVIGAQNAMTLEAGATKVAATKLPDDDLTTRIRGVSGQQQSFYVDVLTGAADVLTVTTFGRNSLDTHGSPGSNETCSIGALRSGSASVAATSQGTNTWGFRTDSGSQARPGGGSYTPADFPGGSAGMEVWVQGPNAGLGSGWRVTTMYFTVTYNFAPGGIASFCGQLVGPLVAVGLWEIPKLVGHLYKVSGSKQFKLSPAEYLTLYRELKEGKRAKHFLMNGGLWQGLTTARSRS